MSIVKSSAYQKGVGLANDLHTPFERLTSVGRFFVGERVRRDKLPPFFDLT